MDRFIFIECHGSGDSIRGIELDEVVDFLSLGSLPNRGTIKFRDRADERVEFVNISNLTLSQFESIIDEYKGAAWVGVISQKRRRRVAKELTQKFS